VVCDENGEIYTVRYDAVNAMLLNEFLKAHHKAQQQEATITQLKSTVTKEETAIAQQRNDFEATIRQLEKEMETVVARFKEQDAKIQKVSDQIELRNPAAQVAVDRP
jgi:septal ring factor EnvC (AmiA/AmiB activator)